MPPRYCTEVLITTIPYRAFAAALFHVRNVDRSLFTLGDTHVLFKSGKGSAAMNEILQVRLARARLIKTVTVSPERSNR
jgi:hypothetical protein